MSDDPRARAARLLARSRFAMPRADALAHVQARRRELLAPAPPAPDPDFTTPESLTIIDAPQKFADDFWKRRASPPQPPKPKGKKRPPDLRVVDGGLDGDKPDRDK